MRGFYPFCEMKQMSSSLKHMKTNLNKTTNLYTKHCAFVYLPSPIPCESLDLKLVKGNYINGENLR